MTGRHFQIKCGDALKTLKTIQDSSIQCCVTSPPYWGLRDYGVNGQLGAESTPEEYVANMVNVFREVRRVLRDDGTLWVNLGDSYWNSNGFARASEQFQRQGRNDAPANDRRLPKHDVLKIKDLVGIPWRVAFALQQDGWYLRSGIIWHKPNPMPESVRDRPTNSHEYIFLLSKSPKYYYDYEAIKEEAVNGDSSQPRGSVGVINNPMNEGRRKQDEVGKRQYTGFNERYFSKPQLERRNKRSVWTVSTKPFSGAHFATFPPDLIEPCILAGCPEGGTVLDPFNGAGTTGLVALRHNRNYLGIELNPEYVEMSKKRIFEDAPLLNVCKE